MYTHKRSMQKKDQQELEALISSIRDAIVNYEWSPREISKALIKVMKQRGDRMPETNFVLDMVAAHYSINRHTLIYGTNRENSEARKFAYCLLYFDVQLTIEDIACKVFKKKSMYRVHTTTAEFRNHNPAIKQDREFIARYEAFQKELQQFILDRRNDEQPNSKQDGPK